MVLSLPEDSGGRLGTQRETGGGKLARALALALALKPPLPFGPFYPVFILAYAFLESLCLFPIVTNVTK